MSEAKHTPGPWIATKAGPVMQGYMQGDAVGSLEHNTLVAGCFSDVRGGPAVAAANARLIAAAPALLEALQKVYRALMSDPPHGPQKHVGPDDVIYQLDGQLMYAAINAARNALALVNASRFAPSAGERST